MPLPMTAFKTMILTSLILSLMWTILFLLHFGLHRFRFSRRLREQRAHFEHIDDLQERYISSSARLDDAQTTNEKFMDEVAWYRTDRDAHRASK